MRFLYKLSENKKLVTLKLIATPAIMNKKELDAFMNSLYHIRNEMANSGEKK